MQRKKAASKRRIQLNTLTAEARIQASIKTDPDNPELTPGQLSQMRPFRELQAERRRGRPKSAIHKVPVKVRLDPHVVEFFRASGRGWHTRMNAVLAAHVKRSERDAASSPRTRPPGK
jgi:uncharacterized protein (DUF4415 family)